MIFKTIASLGFVQPTVAAPSAPTIVSITAGDTQATISLTAASATDVVYARYAAWVSGAWTAWSAEDIAFARVGDGDITITGLTNGTKYMVAIYAKSANLTSDWRSGVVTPTDGSNAPSSPLALALDNLAKLLASSSTFQTLVGAIDEVDALDYISKIADESIPIPCAIVSYPDNFSIELESAGARNYFTKSGDLDIIIRAEIDASHDYEVASNAFMNTIGNIVEEMSEASGYKDYLNATGFVVDFPQRPDTEERITAIRRSDGTAINDFYQCFISVAYGGL